jgi:hypothetical protein
MTSFHDASALRAVGWSAVRKPQLAAPAQPGEVDAAGTFTRVFFERESTIDSKLLPT